MRIKTSRLYMSLFVLMCVTCALFSSSTPDNVGVPEITVGLILVVLVGISGLRTLFEFQKSHDASSHAPVYLKISAIYLLFVPSITGILISQNVLSDYIRDFIPLLYMLIPMLLYRRVQSDPQMWLLVIIGAISIIGISYSVRHFTDGGGDLSQVGKEFIWGGNLDNIVQDPATLFVLSFFSAATVWFLFRGELFKGIICLTVATFPWVATIATILRAPVFLTLIVILWAIFLSKRNIKQNLPTMVLLVMVVVGTLLAYGELFIEFTEGALALLIRKHEVMGLSSRDLEVIAVINNVDSIYILLLGGGWGALIDSPLSTGAGWRFVHNMFLYFFFKTGLLGVVALLAYLNWFVQLIRKNYDKIKGIYFLICVALIVPLFISMMLEPMFKALTFGIVLLIIPLVVINVSINKESYDDAGMRQ